MKIILTTAALLLAMNGVAMASTSSWNDWPNEPEEVRKFITENNLMLGYPDGTFRPWNAVTEKQVVRVCKRAGIRTDLDENQYSDMPATMGWVTTYFLPGTAKTAGMEEECTRYRLATMLYRYGLKPGPTPIPPSTSEDSIIADRLDKWFDEMYVTWNGVTRQNKLVGLGKVFVEESNKHRIPIWLALGQCWRESQWFTTGLSVTYNCGWGMKASVEKWGQLGSPSTIQGYGNYISVEEAVRAYFKYMDEQTTGNGQPLYRNLIDQEKWQEVLNIYAPPFENNAQEHYNIVMTVRKWAADRGITR
jgi:hypothetical protein